MARMVVLGAGLGGMAPAYFPLQDVPRHLGTDLREIPHGSARHRAAQERQALIADQSHFYDPSTGDFHEP